MKYHMPGKAPDSARPKRRRSSRKLVGPRVAAKEAATMPHMRVIRASHLGAPKWRRRMLLGTWGEGRDKQVMKT
jgi:hypothetical protein